MKRNPAIGLVLAVLAIPSGFAVLSIAGNIAGVVSVDPGIVWLVVFSLVLILPGGVLLLSNMPTLRNDKAYPTEARTVPTRGQLTHPDVIPDVITILDNAGATGKRLRLNDIVSGREILTLADMAINREIPLTYRNYTGKGKPFGDVRFREIVDGFVSCGLLERGDKNYRQGVYLTRSGRGVLSHFARLADKARGYKTPAPLAEGMTPYKPGRRATDSQTARQTVN